MNSKSMLLKLKCNLFIMFCLSLCAQHTFLQFDGIDFDPCDTPQRFWRKKILLKNELISYLPIRRSIGKEYFKGSDKFSSLPQPYHKVR